MSILLLSAFSIYIAAEIPTHLLHDALCETIQMLHVRVMQTRREFAVGIVRDFVNGQAVWALHIGV